MKKIFLLSMLLLLQSTAFAADYCKHLVGFWDGWVAWSSEPWNRTYVQAAVNGYGSNFQVAITRENGTGNPERFNISCRDNMISGANPNGPRYGFTGMIGLLDNKIVLDDQGDYEGITAHYEHPYS